MHNSINVQAVSLISPKSCLLSLSRVMGRLCDLGVSKNYFGRQLKFLLQFISLSGGYQGKRKFCISAKSSHGTWKGRGSVSVFNILLMNVDTQDKESPWANIYAYCATSKESF